MRLYQDLCGRDARAPGWLSPLNVVDNRRHNIAEAFGRRSSLKELHPYSCLFVFIRGSSTFPKRKRLAVSPLNDPPGRVGAGLAWGASSRIESRPPCPKTLDLGDGLGHSGAGRFGRPRQTG